MAAPDGDRANAARLRALAGKVERFRRQPQSGQAAAVEHDGARPVGQDLGLAGRRHVAVFDLFEVAGELGEAVRAVAHRIRGDELFGRHRCLVGVEPGGREEAAGKVGQSGEGVCRHAILVGGLGGQ